MTTNRHPWIEPSPCPFCCVNRQHTNATVIPSGIRPLSNSSNVHCTHTWYVPSPCPPVWLDGTTTAGTPHAAASCRIRSTTPDGSGSVGRTNDRLPRGPLESSREASQEEEVTWRTAERTMGSIRETSCKRLPRKIPRTMCWGPPGKACSWGVELSA